MLLIWGGTWFLTWSFNMKASWKYPFYLEKLISYHFAPILFTKYVVYWSWLNVFPWLNFQGLCKRKVYDDESFSIMSLLRKKLQEHSRLSLQKESESTSVTSSSSFSSSNNAATDPLLLSFVYNPPQTHSSAETSSSKMLSKDDTLDRYYAFAS